MSEIEIRGQQEGVEIAEVSYPKRTVTVIVAPYETPTTINTPYRSFTEVVTRGAYDGVQRRAGNIKANRDHDWARITGKATDLHPDRDEGLVAEVRMVRTPTGDETLELCADGCLAASAGFGLMRENGATGPVKPNAEVWEENRTVRRLNELHLDHISFVPNPAYETATVIDVRRAEPEPVVLLPNLSRIEIDELRAQMAALDARYGV